MRDTAPFKEKLQTRLAELQSRLHHIEEDLDEPSDADVEERATEREGDEVMEGLGNAGLAEIRQIEQALKRIEAGTYGDCVTCGEEISEERLELLPHTSVCRNCAA
ncbi:MAG: TraR/DksA family transcriptional regulator [Alphaproteobacteria bacterium]|nr:MAG: TraR/DksA family transcriptional regulator [Alphaproteobacteria bacterium]